MGVVSSNQKKNYQKCIKNGCWSDSTCSCDLEKPTVLKEKVIKFWGSTFLTPWGPPPGLPVLAQHPVAPPPCPPLPAERCAALERSLLEVPLPTQGVTNCLVFVAKLLCCPLSVGCWPRMVWLVHCRLEARSEKWDIFHAVHEGISPGT